MRMPTLLLLLPSPLPLCPHCLPAVSISSDVAVVERGSHPAAQCRTTRAREGTSWKSSHRVRSTKGTAVWPTHSRSQTKPPNRRAEPAAWFERSLIFRFTRDALGWHSVPKREKPPARRGRKRTKLVRRFRLAQVFPRDHFQAQVSVQRKTRTLVRYTRRCIRSSFSVFRLGLSALSLPSAFPFRAETRWRSTTPTSWAPLLKDRAGTGACAAGSWRCSAFTEQGCPAGGDG